MDIYSFSNVLDFFLRIILLFSLIVYVFIYFNIRNEQDFF